MPARNTADLEHEIKGIRKRAWLHEVFQNLGLSTEAGDFGRPGSSGTGACRRELLRIAGTHPVTLSLALDAWTFEPADGEGEGSDDDEDAAHPQADLLPNPESDYESFPAAAELPDLAYDSDAGVYMGHSEQQATAITDVPAALTAALAQIKTLQDNQARLERDLDSRARAQAVRLLEDANTGLAEVSLVAASQSKREAHRATAYDLAANFQVAPWDRDAGYTNVLGTTSTRNGDTVPDFAQLLFRNSMRRDDFKRLQRLSGVQPRHWRNAGTYDAKDVGLMSAAAVKQDEAWRAEQNGLLTPLKPVVRALDCIGAALALVPSEENSPGGFLPGESDEIDKHDAESLLTQLRFARSMLSDAVHTVAYNVTGVQKRRDKALQREIAGGDFELDEEPEEDSGDWTMDTSALHDRAKTFRTVRRELGKTQSSRRPNGRGGAAAGKNGGKDGWQQKKKNAAGRRSDTRTPAQKESDKRNHDKQVRDRDGAKKKKDAAE